MTDLLIQWQILVIPAIVMIISQVTKVTLHALQGSLDWKELNSYGGMPSSHTALFTSLAVIVGLTQGFTSPLFFVTAFVSAVFIRDAFGIRWSLGSHSRVLNHLIETLPADIQKTFPDKLQERLGHTPLEVFIGAILGAGITLLLHWILLTLA